MKQLFIFVVLIASIMMILPFFLLVAECLIEGYHNSILHNLIARL